MVEGLAAPADDDDSGAASRGGFNRRPHRSVLAGVSGQRVERWDSPSIRASSSSHLALEFLAGLLDLSDPLGEDLARLGTLHLGDDPGAEAEEDLPSPVDGPPQVGLPADRDEELAFGTDPLESLERLAGPPVVAEEAVRYWCCWSSVLSWLRYASRRIRSSWTCSSVGAEAALTCGASVTYSTRISDRRYAVAPADLREHPLPGLVPVGASQCFVNDRQSRGVRRMDR